jgi:hypothetical protein
MLFFGHAKLAWPAPPRFRWIRMSGILAALLAILAALPSTLPADTGAGRPPAQAWMRVEKTVIPIRENTEREAAILGYAQIGDVLAVEKEGQNWVKLRVNDNLAGWVPRALVAPSGPPVRLDGDWVKRILFSSLGFLAAVLLGMALRMSLKRRAESLERSRQALADARRRLQNKIQLLFRYEPRIASHLVTDEVDVAEFLRNIGYDARIEKDPALFLAACKEFKPNLVIAADEFREAVEEMVQTDALLVNTPVLYLGSGKIPEEGGSPDGLGTRPAGNGLPGQGGQVRAFLEGNATDKDLGAAISFCLRKSPERIRYSVKPVALKGEVRDGTMVELLHFLATVKRSGQLLAVDGKDRGEVLLHEGEIIGAAFRGQTGARGTEQLLELGSGTFEFHEKGTKAVSGAINTHKLLLDWAKTRDERDHHTGA